MHIGKKIAEVLADRRMSRQALGRALGLTGSAATYLTTRPTIDVATLAAIGEVLDYDFFSHYPRGKDKEENSRELSDRIAELERQNEAVKRDLILQKQENGYLKKINSLLEKRAV